MISELNTGGAGQEGIMQRGERESGRMTRRHFIRVGAAVGAGALVSPGGVALASGQGPSGFPHRFLAPTPDVQPKFRWWWPHGLVDRDEIVREIDQIADAGFGGVEIADVHHSVSEPLDPKGHGWGTPPWVAAVEAALERARQRGVIVDLTIGPSWPAAVPTITPDSEAAIKELAHGMALVAGGETHDGPVPAPAVAPSPNVTQQRLHAVQAARIGGDSADSPILLDDSSVVDLTDRVQDGRIAWTAPAEGQWALIAYWERGSGQRPERGPHTEPDSYVIDHFSRAGTRAVIDFWEANVLTPRMRRLLRQAGGAFFEDSIELETDATLWTPELEAEFERRMGYALTPYLPVVVEENEDPVFEFDEATSRQVRRDYGEVITELYIERHLEPLQAWAHSIGMKLRIQPYGLETDAIAKAAIVDIPEGESLGFKNHDDFRCLAGGRDMGGKRILSNEAGATAGGAYTTAWDTTLEKLAGQYAAGVNQAVLHGFSYASAPGANWPGFAAFTPYDGRPGFGESWGPRQPTWRHITDISGWMARTQTILQSGTNRVDAAILRQKGYAGSGFGAPWFTPDGVPTGWTHQIISPRLLHLESARISRGRLAPDGPAYKVLVFEGDVFEGRERTLQVDTAERLVAFARAGLPIIVVGDWSDPRVPGLPRPGENERLRELIAELLAQPSVRNVADRPGIPGALTDLGIRPDVEYAQRSPLLNAHRTDDGVDYYYLCNGSTTATVDHAVALAAGGRDPAPYRLDAWTGRIERIDEYERVDGRLRIPVTLKPGDSTIVAIARRSWHPGRPAIDPIPTPIPLERWRLEVEDWRPGGSPTETVKIRHVVALDALKPWTEIPGLEDVSGIGRYRTTVELGRAHGAYLDLGEVLDTFRVTINGRRLPPANQVSAVVDAGPHLRPGTNTIEVEVATPLGNRLRVSDPGVYGVLRRQAYGLIGPVRLVP
jgi:glycosyl hydrolase family 106( putative alpha-L-rhamnosidase)